MKGRTPNDRIIIEEHINKRMFFILEQYLKGEYILKPIIISDTGKDFWGELYEMGVNINTSTMINETYSTPLFDITFGRGEMWEGGENSTFTLKLKENEK